MDAVPAPVKDHNGSLNAEIDEHFHATGDHGAEIDLAGLRQEEQRPALQVRDGIKI